MLDECDAVHTLQAKFEGVFEVCWLKFYNKQQIILLNVDLLILEDH